MILGLSRETVAEAVRLHKAGETLAKSKPFLAAIPPGHPRSFRDAISGPSCHHFFTAANDCSGNGALADAEFEDIMPAVVSVCGDENTIREASGSGAYDFGAITVVAAIAIPNLLRSRMAANEASAVGSCAP